MITATITNKVIDTANFKNLSIAEDAIDTVQFSLAKTYDGTDLSAGTVYSLWVIPGGDGDMTELTSEVSVDNLLAVWPLSGAVVSRKGMVEFQLVIMDGTTNMYQTKVARFYVDRRLDPDTLEFTPAVLTAHLASVIAERVLAESAADEAEAVLADTDFQAVAADLALGAASTIKIVSTDIADVSTVAADATDIGVVATDLALGASSTIGIVAGISTNVTTVAGIDTEVIALAGKTTEIDALYAEIENIGTKATVASVDAIKGTGWTDENLVDHEERIATLEGCRLIACAIRVNVDGTWSLIDDAQHTPIGVASVAVSTSDMTITYDFTATEVGSLVVTADETLKAYGLTLGASVGLSSSIIRGTINKTVGGYITYDGSAWSTYYCRGVSGATFSNGLLTVTHDSLDVLKDATNVFNVSAIARDGNITLTIGSLGLTTTPIQIRDYSGALITTPNTNMKIHFTRTISGNADFSKLYLADGNLWVYGVMKV